VSRRHRDLVLLVVRFPCLAAGRGRDFDADCAAHYTEMGRRIGAMTVEFLTEMGNEPDYIGGTAAGV
jgi:hypothetical protein